MRGGRAPVTDVPWAFVAGKAAATRGWRCQVQPLLLLLLPLLPLLLLLLSPPLCTSSASSSSQKAQRCQRQKGGTRSLAGVSSDRGR